MWASGVGARIQGFGVWGEWCGVQVKGLGFGVWGEGFGGKGVR